MSTNLPAKAQSTALVAESVSQTREFVTFMLAGQLFGIPVLQVQDVLGPQKITRVPLAPTEVAGSLNLRGRIVTAIDMRVRLGLPLREANTGKSMSIVVDVAGELYSLIVDQVGEVMALPHSEYEKNPATLDEKWREVADGIYRLKESLMIVLDVQRLLRVETHVAA